MKPFTTLVILAAMFVMLLHQFALQHLVQTQNALISTQATQITRLQGHVRELIQSSNKWTTPP